MSAVTKAWVTGPKGGRYYVAPSGQKIYGREETAARAAALGVRSPRASRSASSRAAALGVKIPDLPANAPPTIKMKDQRSPFGIIASAVEAQDAHRGAILMQPDTVKAIGEMSKNVSAQISSPNAPGVKRVEVGPFVDELGDPIDASGAFDAKTNRILIRDDVAERLGESICKGEISDGLEYNAAIVLSHELFHSASDKSAVTDCAKRPVGHLMLEEATNEILAQHYIPEVLKTVGLENSSGVSPELFRWNRTYGDPELQIACGYPTNVQAFARFAVAVKELHHDTHSDKELNEGIAKMAVDVKRMGVDDRHRFLVDELDKTFTRNGHPIDPATKDEMVKLMPRLWREHGFSVQSMRESIDELMKEAAANVPK